MAKALKVRILDLVAELFAHAFIVLGVLAPAGTVSAGAFEPLLDYFDDLFIGIERDFHDSSSLVPFLLLYHEKPLEARLFWSERCFFEKFMLKLKMTEKFSFQRRFLHGRTRL